jgi:hypothetical protein
MQQGLELIKQVNLILAVALHRQSFIRIVKFNQFRYFDSALSTTTFLNCTLREHSSVKG